MDNMWMEEIQNALINISNDVDDGIAALKRGDTMQAEQSFKHITDKVMGGREFMIACGAAEEEFTSIFEGFGK